MAKKKAKSPEPVEECRPPTSGPRGGTTTVSPSGMVKKNLWIAAEDAERLRVLAFEQRVSEAELMRQGIAAVLDGEVGQ